MSCCGADSSSSDRIIVNYKDFLAQFVRQSHVIDEFQFIIDVLQFQDTDFESYKSWNKEIDRILAIYTDEKSDRCISIDTIEIEQINQQRRHIKASGTFDNRTARYIFDPIYRRLSSMLITTMASYLAQHNYHLTPMQVFKECVAEQKKEKDEMRN